MVNGLNIEESCERAVVEIGLDYIVGAPDKEKELELWATFKQDEHFIASETSFLLAEINKSHQSEIEDSCLPGPSARDDLDSSMPIINDEPMISGPTTSSSEISLLQTTEMANKICEFATNNGDAILVDYASIVHSILKSYLEKQSK